MAENGTLGDRLRRKRREHSFTQEELAEVSGVSQVMIAKIEQGPAGLSAQLHDTKGVLDLTATVHRPGGKETDVRALATITAGQRS
jgi:transcriptional regulator with XRE-family HTH domain